ncbi:DNA polymerase delta subunit 2 [Balamuthia mandrillaris]
MEGPTWLFTNGDKEETGIVCNGKSGGAFDDFLSGPALIDPMNHGAEPMKLERKTLPTEFTHQRFVIKEKQHLNQQYASLYDHRLLALRPVVAEKANAKWRPNDDSTNEPRHHTKILEIAPGEKCFVTGTLYRDMPLRPNILESYAKERTIIPPPVHGTYASDQDKFILEDDSGRLRLLGTIESEYYVTGMVVAVKGVALDGGEFQIEEILLPDLPPQPRFVPACSDDCYVALVSGLCVGDSTHNPLYLEMLVDYISGHIGSSLEQSFEAKIVRVILAGNSLVAPEETPEGAKLRNYQRKLGSRQEKSSVVSPLRLLDQLVSQLASSVPVDFMPGENDPSNFSLPQQPLSRCLLPTSTKYSTFTPVTNPYEVNVGGALLLGTSGQPVDNISKYVKQPDPLSYMEATLRCRHIAPTAPDTLGCYPFTKFDPFVLETCPHVYFVGNQPRYETKCIEGNEGQAMRLITIPRFSDTHTIVLLNLRTLNCHPITFDLPF